MRFFTALVNGEYKPGLALDDRAAFFADLGFKEKTLLEWLQKEESVPPIHRKDLGRKLTDLTLAAPLPHPPHDILCVGKNYLEHIQEMQGSLGADAARPVPHYFGKRAAGVLGPTDPIRGFFALDAKLDYEVELAVVIGKSGMDIPRERVWDHIFGLTILNDLSSRTLQNKHIQWYRGKSLDGYTVMGPWIVHADRFEKPLRLELTTSINGELRQKANTSQMIFTVEDLIAELSQGICLKPGDIIATGTPSGVGMGFSPPRFLKPGDTVRMEVEKIGVLENRVVHA